MSRAARLLSLATGQTAIVASRLAGAGVGFITQFLLVKLMGAKDLGLFYAASSFAAVLGVFVSQGYPQIAARFVGRYRNKKADGLLNRFSGHALREGLIAAVISAAIVTTTAMLWPGLDAGTRAAYGIAAWMVVAIVSLNITTNIAGGMRNFVLCYMPEGFLRPILFCVVVAALGLIGIRLDGERAMMVFALITGGLAVAVWLALSRMVPNIRWGAASQAGLRWRWRFESWQLLLMAVFTNFFADVGIVITVPFLTKPEIAVFGLCLKLALLVGYFVQIGQQMAVPDMADARHHGDTTRLRRAALRSIVGPTLICLAGLAVVIPLGDFLLSFFGPEFATSGGVLAVVLGSQLVRAVFGPGVHLLTLRGNQGVNMALSLSAFIVFYLAAALLCPLYGAMGAALAVLIVQVYWSGACAVVLALLDEPGMHALWLLAPPPRQRVAPGE